MELGSCPETYKPGSCDQSPFVDWGWEIFLLPHDLNLSLPDLDRLRSAASAVGDHHALISGESHDRFSSLLADFDPRGPSDVGGRALRVLQYA
jgi:hypothetical protein